MRQLFVRVPRGCWEEVLDLAGDLGAVNTARLEAETREEWDLLLLHIPNDAVDGLLEKLEDLSDFRATLNPSGVLPFQHPGFGSATPIADLSPRSPVEVLLQRRLQIPALWIFVVFSAMTGAIAWIGLYEEVIYLLTAAMLVAPFAAPALNAGAATATGDLEVLFRSWGRYVGGVGLTVATAAGLTLAAGLSVPTGLALDIAALSTYSLLLPIAAGVAGSLFIFTTEENSTVSGAAVSMLVAAAIAPPAGVAGMALVTGDWALVAHTGFLLLAQLAGINLVSAIVFRRFGLTSYRPGFTEGGHGVFLPTVIATSAVIVGLFAAQVLTGPALQQVDHRRSVVDSTWAALERTPEVELVDVEVRTATTDAVGRVIATIRVVGDENAADAVHEALLPHAGDAVWNEVLVDVVVVTPLGDP